jgi:hypothetical protein
MIMQHWMVPVAGEDGEPDGERGEWRCPRCELHLDDVQAEAHANGMSVPEIHDKLACAMCGGIDEHTDGCPSLGPKIVHCGQCDEEISIGELAQHLLEDHGMEVDEEMIQQSIVQAEAGLREIMAAQQGRGFFSARDAYPTMSLTEIFVAIGHRTTTGFWPPNFDAQGALLYAMDHLDQANRRLKHHHQHVPEGVDHLSRCEICRYIDEAQDRGPEQR